MKYSIVGYAVTFGFVTLSTVISEFAQIVSDKYDKPFIIRYVNDSSNIFGLLVPLIWLCTSSLFAKKIKKDREKLLKRHCNKTTTSSSSPSPHNLNHSMSYQYHGSPLGMGVHPLDPPKLEISSDTNSEAGSLFDRSILSTTSSMASSQSLVPAAYNDNSIGTNIGETSESSQYESQCGTQSLNGIYDSIDSNKYSFVCVNVSDTSHLSLNKKESNAFSKLLIDSDLRESKYATQQNRKMDIVRLHLFHPNPNQYKRYKDALKHIHSPIDIALVKSNMYYFIPFLVCLSWLYSGGGMLWYLSLTGTTVPTNTCLARFRVLFVFFLSAIFFNEVINLWKILGIFFAFGSVCLFAVEIESQNKNKDSSQETHDTLSGALLILLAALFSGCGDVVYRIGENKCLNGDSIYGLQLIVTFFFNGLYGLVILTTFWGIFYIEPFIMPDPADIHWIFAVSIILMIANVIQFISISMTSPFFLNVCLFLKIPLSFIIDTFIHNYRPGLYSISGGILVIVGFLMLEIVNPPKWCPECKKILEYPWFTEHIENVRKRTQSFNISIT